MSVGQDDLDVGIRDHGSFFGCAGILTGGASVRISLAVFDAVCVTATHHGMKLGDVVSTLRASGFGVVTVVYKNLSFAVGDKTGKQNLGTFCVSVGATDRESTEETEK